MAQGQICFNPLRYYEGESHFAISQSRPLYVIGRNKVTISES